MEETQDVGVELNLDFVRCTTKFGNETSRTHLRAVLIIRLRQMESAGDARHKEDQPS